jgi:hypothetical protein
MINVEKRGTHISLSDRSTEFSILGNLMKQSFKINTYVLDASLFQISLLLVPTRKTAVNDQHKLKYMMKPLQNVEESISKYHL